jgi:hypothetical protein
MRENTSSCSFHEYKRYRYRYQENNSVPVPIVLTQMIISTSNNKYILENIFYFDRTIFCSLLRYPVHFCVFSRARITELHFLLRSLPHSDIFAMKRQVI